MEWKKISVKDLTQNVFQMIGDEWMLVTAEKDGKVNTMTASWAPLASCGEKQWRLLISVRRDTRKNLSMHRKRLPFRLRRSPEKAMGLLGSVSGRDEADKIEKSGLHVTKIDGHPTFEEASLVLVCRKLYVQEMKPECFLHQEEIEKWYPDSDFHWMYMAEITDAYVTER